MKKYILAFIFIMITVSFVWAVNKKASNEAASKNSKIVATAINFKNSNGDAVFCLYTADSGFITDTSKAYKIREGKIINGKSQVIFDNLPPGSYEVKVIHDENMNDKLDTSEGYAITGSPVQNTGNYYGTQAFNDAMSPMGQQNQQPIIRINYNRK